MVLGATAEPCGWVSATTLFRPLLLGVANLLPLQHNVVADKNQDWEPCS